MLLLATTTAEETVVQATEKAFAAALEALFPGTGISWNDTERLQQFTFHGELPVTTANQCSFTALDPMNGSTLAKTHSAEEAFRIRTALKATDNSPFSLAQTMRWSGRQ